MTDHIDISRLESTLLAPGSPGDEELARIRLHLEAVFVFIHAFTAAFINDAFGIDEHDIFAFHAPANS